MLVAQIRRKSTLHETVAADRPVLAFLQHAQQLGLQERRHLADLVQHQRAAGRQFEQADAVGGGAGERALLVAEELRLDEILRQRRAVDLDERALGPRRSGDGSRWRSAPCRCRCRPWMRMFASLSATASISSKSSRIFLLLPITFENAYCSRIRSLSSWCCAPLHLQRRRPDRGSSRGPRGRGRTFQGRRRHRPGRPRARG